MFWHFDVRRGLGETGTGLSLDELECKDYAWFKVTAAPRQQALTADGAIACFSSNLFLCFLNADRPPQLKRNVLPPIGSSTY